MNVHLFRSFYLFFLIAICLHCTVRYCISVSWEEGRKWSTFTQVSHSKAWWQEMTFSCTVVEECNLCRRAAADLCLHLRLLQVWSQLLCRMSPQGGSLGADCLWELCRESSPVIPVDCCFILFLSNQFDMLFLEMLLRQHSMENVLVFFFFLNKQDCSAFPSVLTVYLSLLQVTGLHTIFLSIRRFTISVVMHHMLRSMGWISRMSLLHEQKSSVETRARWPT